MLSKSIILAVCGLTTLVAANPTPELEARGNSWRVSFFQNNCASSVSPGKVSGSGVVGCRGVSGAKCATGSTDAYSGLKVCIYAGSGCTGAVTSLDDRGEGQTSIYANGAIQAMNSYRVSNNGC